MLLTVSLGKSESGIAKPLTPREWGEFAGWLKARDCVPGDVLKEDLSGLLQGWEHPKVTTERLQGPAGSRGNAWIRIGEVAASGIVGVDSI